ncbi:MAG: fimbrillin family protein [Rikenellaceae bacterium]
MKRKLRSIIIYIVLIVLSCTKKIENSESRITFYGSHYRETKSSTTLENGTRVVIYAFEPNDINNPHSRTPMELFAAAGGVLTPATPLFLPRGSYDFYSVSLNKSSNSGITFSGGVSGQLSNGEDYLWASSKNSSVNGNTNIILTYKHTACKVNISINEASNISNVCITSVKYTLPSETALRMNLGNGTIQASASVSPLSTIPGTGNSRTFICLPCSAAMEVEIKLNAIIDGEPVTNKTFRASINAIFEQGNMYNIIYTLTSHQEFQALITSTIWTSTTKSTEI